MSTRLIDGAADVRALPAERAPGRGRLAGAEAIPRRERRSTASLSFAQQRLWFIEQLAPGKSLYNEHGQLQFTGPLLLAVLKSSIGEVIRNHEVLRTVFPACEGAPAAVIQPFVAPEMPVIDLEALPPGAKETVVGRLANAAARRPFDLANGPLIRLAAIRLAVDEHLVLLTMHQMVSDGWSLSVFAADVAAAYAALSSGIPSPACPPRIQYADFA